MQQLATNGTANSHPLWVQIQSIESNANIQTVRCVTGQRDCTQTCEFYSHEYKNLTATKVVFYKTIFSLCYTPPSIETPLRMTIVLFSSGGSVFFFW